MTRAARARSFRVRPVSLFPRTRSLLVSSSTTARVKRVARPRSAFRFPFLPPFRRPPPSPFTSMRCVPGGDVHVLVSFRATSKCPSTSFAGASYVRMCVTFVVGTTNEQTF